MNNYKKLPPFKWFCLTNFPFIEADFDALTNYELLCKVVQYLNEVIVKTNELGEQVEILTNWFDNLDVQDEIDHKLDEMAESGELAEIISQYLNSTAIFGFNNVASMKSATNLIDGSYAKTLGYYTKNDGGGSVYKIRTITNDDVVDNAFIIPMTDETLVAELIINDNTSILQLGGKNDNSTDNSNIAELSISKLGYCYLPKGEYKLNIDIDTDIDIDIYGDGQDTILSSYETGGDVINITTDLITKPKIVRDLFINLQGNENGVIIALNTRIDNFYPHKIDVHNVKIYTTNNFTGIGFKFENIREFNVNDLVVRRDRGNDSARTGTGIYIAGCLDIDIKNSDLGFLNKGIDIETKDYSTEGVLIDNVDIFFCNYAIKTTIVNNKQILDLRILNCNVDQIQQVGFELDGVISAYIFNNWLGAYIDNTHLIKLISGNITSSQIHINQNTLQNTFSNKVNNSNILIDTTNNNIDNINIIDNTILHYNEKGIEIIGSRAINHLLIQSNILESSTSVSGNVPLTYVTKPLNMKLIDNIVKAGSLFVLDDATFNAQNNKGIYNKTMLNDFTTPNNHQNTNDFPIMVIVGATNSSGSQKRINYYLGATSSSMQELTQEVSTNATAGHEQLVSFVVPSNWWYAVNSDATITQKRIIPIQ